MSTSPLDLPLDGVAERVRRSHAAAIKELQEKPITGAILKRNLKVLVNNTITIAHGLGREPQFVTVSAVRFPVGAPIAAGSWIDYGSLTPNGTAIDRSKSIVLGALGFTSLGSFELTFDLLVM